MKRFTLLSIVILLSACSGDLDVVDENNDTPLEHGHVDYRGAGFGEESLLEDPVRPDKEFRGASFMLTSMSPQGRYQVQWLDGTWSEWRDFEYTWQHRKFQSQYFELEAPAQALRLDYDAASSEFVRLEFHEHSHGAVDTHDDSLIDFVSGFINEFLGYELNKPGRWGLPAATRQAGVASSIGYDSAPRWSRRNCSGGLKVGAKALGDFLTDNFVGARYFQGYNCRQIRGSSSMSMHGTGRAIDVFVPLDRGRADNDLGDEIANYLVENSEALGIQMVIWDQTIWRAGRADRRYGGAHPHHDHLHIELTHDAAARSQIDLTRTPGEPSPWIGTPCSSDSDCGFSANGATGFCHEFGGDGFCSLSCEGLCPDRRGEAYTFCTPSASMSTGLCASYAATQNQWCGGIPGTEAREVSRYVGSSSLSARRRTVCLPPASMEPATEPAWVGTPCSQDSECDFSADGTPAFCYTFGNDGFCGLPCEGLCPDRTGEAPTFCVESDVDGMGVCASYSAAQNNWCNAIPGTQPRAEDRYIGSANVLNRTRTVCVP